MILISTVTGIAVTQWLQTKVHLACGVCVAAHQELFLAIGFFNFMGVAAAIHLAWHLLVERRRSAG